ncbi:PH domain-containing protein [uncultured Pontibacter sp.]|uniref:PH domain-containing protein n=1 Tax=uncultured Pontibacter sp. TaxID=453356 RepID=UPI002621136D|nr:PH domain-containing protein [uncultured Pontibacter sp.]
MGLLNGLMGHASAVPVEKLTKEFQPILLDDENIEKAFRLIRDMLVFTNKRLIVVNKQGLTGSKIEYQSVPYSSIKMFSKESAGMLDFDAELKIWLTGEATPTIKQEFRKGDNVNEAYKVLSKYVLK